MDENHTPVNEGDAPGYSVEELAELGGVPVRTVRFYISEGVLPGPGARGRAATYTEDHLLRLRLVRRLAERRVPLAEMRAMLEPLSAEETRALLEDEEAHTATLWQAAQSPSPREYIAALLSRAQASRQPGIGSGEAAKASRAQSAPGNDARKGPDRPGASPPPPLDRPPAVKSYSPPGPVPWQGTPPGKERKRSDSEPASAWQRWVLAPGVELHVRAESVGRYRDLIRRLLRAAGLVEQSEKDEP